EGQAKRIAHALHDEAGQLLSSIYLTLAELERGPAASNQPCLHRLHGLLDQFHRELRRLSHELRPKILDDLGVLAAIETYAKGLSIRTGLEIRVAGRARRLPRAIETALYRIVQESLNNAAKHAQAKAARVELRVDTRQARCS